jgi:hypothetical protein
MKKWRAKEDESHKVLLTPTPPKNTHLHNYFILSSHIKAFIIVTFLLLLLLLLLFVVGVGSQAELVHN